MLKYAFHPYTLMYWNSFVPPYTRAINPAYKIFNMRHAIANLNYIYEYHGFEEYLRELKFTQAEKSSTKTLFNFVAKL